MSGETAISHMPVELGAVLCNKGGVDSLDLFAPRPSSASSAAGRFSREVLGRTLNGPQLEAVMHPAAPLLVVAGAGSGKTRVITYRLARLLSEGADPFRIFVVTFTNKAAGELRERVAKLMGGGEHLVRGLWMGTFHGLSARLLRRYGEAIGLRKDFVIYDTDDQRRLMQRVLTDLKVPEKQFPVRQVLGAIDRAKNKGVDADKFEPADFFEDTIAKAYRVYEERLRAANAIDFGGLLLKALKLCHPGTPAGDELMHRFDHVLVDEFQDTNHVQYRLVRYLSRATNSITVVGDEDQSIYGWRGADIRNILDFERDHPGSATVKLEENYRSTGNVLKVANAIIAKNTERRDKRLFTSSAAGAPILAFEGETERDEAEFVASRIRDALQRGAAPKDFAVFYRTNGQSRVIEEALRVLDLPYVVVGGTRFYDRAEVKDLLAYLRVLLNPDDSVGLGRIINTPARGIGQSTLDKCEDLASAEGVSLWHALALAVKAPDILGAGPRKKLEAFCTMMLGLRQKVDEGMSPADLAEQVLDVSGYRDALAQDASLEAEGRLENLMELVAQMREYEAEAEAPELAEFLERVALVADADSIDPESGAISLMTVHTAKGLEFPHVFVTGLEEGVFPHQRSIDDDAAIEEERRLCYVAVTRAMEQLYLSRVRRRRLAGQSLGGIPSRFLRDVPFECTESLVQPRPSYYGANTEGQGPWGGRWNREAPERAKSWVEDEMETPSRGRWAEFSHLPPAPPRAPQPPAKGAPASNDLTVHYDDLSPDLGMRIGAKLRHPKFGVGEVRGWQSAGGDVKVTMRFPQVGVKTILAKFLGKP
ncbi:MAG: UvrD-helicase domain-containing protein [Myxococcales bacterium]|nr:UvrD-helicase domain-containing protein [Myxococcales bacterium]